jgi:hypothetical protein
LSSGNSREFTGIHGNVKVGPSDFGKEENALNLTRSPDSPKCLFSEKNQKEMGERGFLAGGGK